MGESLSAQVSKTDLSPLREGCKVKKRRKMADVNVEVVYEANLGTGEGPFWLPQEKAVLFVDIPGHSVLRYDTVTKTTTKATYGTVTDRLDYGYELWSILFLFYPYCHNSEPCNSFQLCSSILGRV
jgi:hypothetical protein